jgi:hypothetical protein
LIDSEDVSTETVTGWMSTLTEATQIYDELSTTSISLILEVANTVITAGEEESAGLTYDKALPLLASVDLAMSALSLNHTYQNQEALLALNISSTSSFSSSPSTTPPSSSPSVDFDASIAVLIRFSDLLSQLVLPGQATVESIKKQFRMKVQEVGSTDSGNNGAEDGTSTASIASISTPLTTTEIYAGVEPSVVLLPFDTSLSPNTSTSSSNHNIKVTTTSTRSEMYESFRQALEVDVRSRPIQSSPLNVRLSDLPCNAPYCNVTITLPTQGPSYEGMLVGLDGGVDETTTVESYSMECVSSGSSVEGGNAPRRENHTCTDGFIISLSCDRTDTPPSATVVGDSWVVTGYCPSRQTQAVCRSLDTAVTGITSLLQDCTVSDRTATNITCVCRIANRRFSNANASMPITGSRRRMVGGGGVGVVAGGARRGGRGVLGRG